MLYTINKPLKTRKEGSYDFIGLCYAQFKEHREFVDKKVAIDLLQAIKTIQTYININSPEFNKINEIINKAITNAEK